MFLIRKHILKMKFLITESNLSKGIIRYMNDKFNPNDLKPIQTEKKPKSIFFSIYGVVVMEQDFKTKIFWFDYDRIWSVFSENLKVKDKYIVEALKIWLETSMNIIGFKPLSDDVSFPK